MRHIEMPHLRCVDVVSERGEIVSALDGGVFVYQRSGRNGRMQEIEKNQLSISRNRNDEKFPEFVLFLIVYN